MIGCILTGHGSFAPGIMGAVEMIAGPQEKFEVVPFLEEETLEYFDEKMQAAVEKLDKVCDGVVIFSDLLGGTPFRSAMLAAHERDSVEVIAGTNLPLLVESSLLRLGVENVSEFLEQMVEVGRTGLIHARLSESQQEDSSEEEGI